jgi:hypothetical protein
MRPLLGEARAVENQHALAIGHGGAQAPPHVLGHPRRLADEMLKGFVAARGVDACQHRAHRLAATVAQQAEQVPTERASLCHVPEAVLERLEPRAQAIEPRRRIARQHRRS